MRPPVHVVEAFGGDPGQLVRLPGGHGTSWRAGSVVLKPAFPGEPIEWLAEEQPDRVATEVAGFQPVISALAGHSER